MKRSAAAALAVLVAALLVAGCGGGSAGGSSSTAPETTTKKVTAPNAPAGSKVVSCEGDGTAATQLRATAVDCDIARATKTEWEDDPLCARGAKSARSSCTVGAFRCQAVKVGEGLSVSCERQGADVTFIRPSAG